MEDLRSHGITKNRSRFEISEAGPWAYEQQSLGFNYRMTDIHAALGISQMKRLDEITQERNKLLENYEKLLNKLPLKLLQIPKECYSSVHLAVIRLMDKDPTRHRATFEQLRANRVGVQLHYSAVHLQPYFRKLGFQPDSFPEAESYSKNALSLPLYVGLQYDEQVYVAELLESLLK